MQLKKLLQLACFFVGVILLTACEKRAQEKTPPTVPPPGELIGTWRTACTKNNRVNALFIETFTFTGNKMTDKIEAFSKLDDAKLNPTCNSSLRLWEAEITTNVTLGPTITPGTSTEHTKIDVTTTKLRFKPKIDSVVDFLNTSSDQVDNDKGYTGYGQTDWVLNEWKDITDIPAARTNYRIGTMTPDIFQVSSKQINGQTQKILTWGDKRGNVDRDKRPVTLETRYAVRQSAN